MWGVVDFCLLLKMSKMLWRLGFSLILFIHSQFKHAHNYVHTYVHMQYMYITVRDARI